MTSVKPTNEWRTSNWRKLVWSVPALLLSLPAVAMLAGAEGVHWDTADFIFGAVMLFGAAGLVELAARSTTNIAYRAGAATAVLSGFLVIWANLAVGMIGNEDNPINLMFGGVLAVAIVGAMIARFAPRGMAGAMAAAGAVQLAIGAYGSFTDLRGGIFTSLLASLWLLSAALFRAATRARVIA